MKQQIRNAVALVLLGLILAWLAMNIWTVTAPGQTKVQTTFGTVNMVPYTEGIHFPVNPLSSFDTYDTRNQAYEVMGLSIPTQDRFNSTANVTVKYQIEQSIVPSIKQDYGTAEEFIHKTLRQSLRSIIRDEGRKQEDSRSLAQSGNVTAMQANTELRLSESLESKGIFIEEVLIQDIEFDPRIQEQIQKTQDNIQKEEIERSNKRIAITKAETLEEQAKGANAKRKLETDANTYNLRELAIANKESVIAKAEAEAEAIALVAQAKAEANKLLGQSVTKNLLDLRSIENEGVLYGKSVGNVPHTVIGDTDLRAIGVPIATK